MSEKNPKKTEAEEQIEALARQKFQQGLMKHDQATKQKMIQAMRENNADPAYIYAFEQTGILVFQETMDQLEPEQLEEWAMAYEAYEEEASS